MRISIFPRICIEKIGAGRNPNSVFPGTLGHIVHMDGFGMAIDGNNPFFSPVYVELADDKDGLATLDVVPEAATPKRIVSKLRRFPISEIITLFRTCRLATSGARRARAPSREVSAVQ